MFLTNNFSVSAFLRASMVGMGCRENFERMPVTSAPPLPQTSFGGEGVAISAILRFFAKGTIP